MAIKGKSITIGYLAWDTSNNVGKTGDVANHTLRLVRDGSVSTPTNSPAECDATNLPGIYKITLTATEMDCNYLIFGGKSSTANIVIYPIQIVTEMDLLRLVHAVVDGVAAVSGNTIAFSEIDGTLETTHTITSSARSVSRE